MDAIVGRTTDRVRLWDENFNLVYSGDGDPGEVIGRLSVSIDAPDGSRRGGRITSFSVVSGFDHEEKLGLDAELRATQTLLAETRSQLSEFIRDFCALRDALPREQAERILSHTAVQIDMCASYDPDVSQVRAR